jgi:hypothetical protein
MRQDRCHRQRFLVGVAFVRQFAGMKPLWEIVKSTCPVLIVHGSRDEPPNTGCQPDSPPRGCKESRSTVEIAPRTEPVGLGGRLRVSCVVQPLGASEIVEVFALPVKRRLRTGRVGEHERFVAGAVCCQWRTTRSPVGFEQAG